MNGEPVTVNSSARPVPPETVPVADVAARHGGREEGDVLALDDAVADGRDPDGAQGVPVRRGERQREGGGRRQALRGIHEVGRGDELQEQL